MIKRHFWVTTPSPDRGRSVSAGPCLKTFSACFKSWFRSTENVVVSRSANRCDLSNGDHHDRLACILRYRQRISWYPALWGRTLKANGELTGGFIGFYQLSVQAHKKVPLQHSDPGTTWVGLGFDGIHTLASEVCQSHTKPGFRPNYPLLTGSHLTGSGSLLGSHEPLESLPELLLKLAVTRRRESAHAGLVPRPIIQPWR